MKKLNKRKLSVHCPNTPKRQETGAVIVLKRGKPFAAVVPIRNADEGTVALSTSQKFLRILDRSRVQVKKEGGISAKELRAV